MPQQPGQRDLGRRRANAASNLRQGAIGGGQIAGTEWEPRDKANALRRTCVEDGLTGPAAQVVHVLNGHHLHLFAHGLDFVDGNLRQTEVTDLAHVSPDAMLETIKAAPLDDQIKVFLCGVCRRANGDLSEMRDEIASWFDGAMDRVSGKYKRHAQLFSFVTALVVSVGLNVSTIRVAQALWDQPALAKSVAANPSLDANAALGQLESMNLPIGWVPEHTTTDRVLSAGLFVGWSGHSRAWWATSILGWLLTAGATLFGAPFWFDTLQQFVRLKGAGPSPADKLNK